MSSPLPNEHDVASRGARRRPKPLQFSIATLLAVVAAYSLLFGMLSWFEVRSVSAFTAITVYFTSIAFSQWALFEGRYPYGASFLVSGVLGVAGTLAWAILSFESVMAFPAPLPILFVCVFLLAGLLGIGLGGLVDLTLLLIEFVGGINRRLFITPEDAWWPASRAAEPAMQRTLRRKVCLGVLALLVILFSFAVYMIKIEMAWRRQDLRDLRREYDRRDETKAEPLD